MVNMPIHVYIGFLLISAKICLAVPFDQSLSREDDRRTLDLDDIVIPKSRLRSGTPNYANDWPSGVIPYVYDVSLNGNDRAKLQSAFDHYRRITCINWVPRNGQRSYVLIKKPPNGLCNSSVGRVGGMQVMNVAQWCLDSFPAMLHEMMHAIGFHHEQTRPDRDSHLNIYWENVDPKHKGYFSIFKGSWTYGTKYDYTSVMHYNAYAGSKNQRMTMTPKDGTDPNILGNAKDLSVTDIYRIKVMYNCEGLKQYELRMGYNPDPNCVDKDPNCNKLARYTYPSQCDTNTSYMVHNCGRSCQVCGPKVGCYRDMPGAHFVPKPSAKHCKRYCYLRGDQYAGFKGGNSCGCSSKLGSKAWFCRNNIEVYYV